MFQLKVPIKEQGKRQSALPAACQHRVWRNNTGFLRVNNYKYTQNKHLEQKNRLTSYENEGYTDNETPILPIFA